MSAPGGRKTPSHRGNGESEDTVSAPRTSTKEPETNQSGEENPATEDARLAEAQGGGEGLPASQGGSQFAKQGLTASQGGPSQTTSRASRGLGDGQTGGDGRPGTSDSDEEADDEASLSSTAHKQKRMGKRPRVTQIERARAEARKRRRVLVKRLPKEHDSELAKIQASVLAIMQPLTSAWQHLMFR